MTNYGVSTPIVGSSSRFVMQVEDVNGNPVNPDNLQLSLRAQGQTLVGPYTYTFPGGDPDSVVVYTGTVGSFYADFLWPNAGVWSVKVWAFPSSGLDTTATNWITEGEVTVSNSSVS